MDKISKLFNKLNKKEKEVLSELIKNILDRQKDIHIKKLEGSDFYRAKKGRFRIIFHYEKSVVIDSVTLRNEKTYKDF